LARYAFTSRLSAIKDRLISEGLALPGGGRELTKLGYALYNKEVSEDDVVTKVSKLLTDLYVYRGLQMVGVGFVPMMVCGQDYRNLSGTRFARFVNEVSAEVTPELDSEDDD
jgi:hypothetical protein